ncbi:MAG: type II toxin-antitoxin system VapC family toxin [Planctomycetes bacterium]|nr:type II toxin-antitoxin system VapC family toxin [Planctomycetota bacterium]
MNIVIDTSAVIAVIANEPEKQRLIELTSGVDIIAPQSVHWEVGNAFSAMFKRKQATLAQVRKAINIYRQIPIRLLDVDLIHSIELSKKFNIYAYDAYIISCALKHKCPVVSLDRTLSDVSKQAGVNVMEV